MQKIVLFYFILFYFILFYFILFYLKKNKNTLGKTHKHIIKIDKFNIFRNIKY